MSEIHPSAPTLTKGRRSHRLRQIVDHWPLLVWLVIFGIAIFGYKKGIVFTRMNGVVDVYQESIAPTEDGTFLKLAEGIETGKTVEDGEIIAYMDRSMSDLEIARFKERRKLSDQGSVEKAHDRLVGLKEDQWKAGWDVTELDAKLDLANQQLLALQGAGSNNALAQRKVEVELNLRMLNLERTSLVARKDGLDDLVKEREEILAEMRSGQTAEDPVNTDLWDAEDKKQLEIMELRGERTILRSQRKGRIDRIVKEPGEYVKAGESIVKVVAEATQILGFLPQQEVSSVNVGDEVWVTSAVDRVTTYKSTITSLSPRIDSVRDAASPLPNQAVRGRTILIDFPTESGFLPGQPVIIHLQPPGELSLIRKFFRMLGIGK